MSYSQPGRSRDADSNNENLRPILYQFVIGLAFGDKSLNERLSKVCASKWRKFIGRCRRTGLMNKGPHPLLKALPTQHDDNSLVRP